MTERDFVYWLRGCLELGNIKTLNETQVDVLKRHLDLILTNVTDVDCKSTQEPSNEAPTNRTIYPGSSFRPTQLC